MNEANMQLPPHIRPNDRVVLFDGVCKLCRGWCRFLIRHDPQVKIKLCSVQSAEGQDILSWLGLPADAFTTMLYLQGNRLYCKSDAFLEIVCQLPRPWCYLRYLDVVPKGLRDWCYDRIALNRYRIFGRYQQCRLPSAEENAHFLTSD